MVEAVKNGQFKRQKPSEIRRAVLGKNQFQLPAFLVQELGFKSGRYSMVGAKVAWYYHEKEDKAVLSTDTVDRSSLELIGASSLSKVSNEELESDVEDSARVTIIKKLPHHLHQMLTRGRGVVMKPQYASEHEKLENTCVSVYPAREYDRGELPNVERTQTQREADESGQGKTEIVDKHSHANSI